MLKRVRARAQRTISFAFYLIALFTAGSSTAYADDARYAYPKQFSVNQKNVNLQTGRFISSQVDLSIGTLSFSRVWGDLSSYREGHKSLGVAAGELQNQRPVGWSHNFNAGVYAFESNATGRVQTVYVDGQRYQFSYSSNGNQILYPSDKPSGGTNLVQISGNFYFTDKSGNVYQFFAHPATNQRGLPGSPNQVLSRVTYANGSVVDYTYNSNAQPHLISSSLGYAIVIDYDGNQNVTKVCGFNTTQTYVNAGSTCAGAALSVSYGYDPFGEMLTSVTDVLSHVVTISYLGAHYANSAGPTCISMPDSGTCELQNVYGDVPGQQFEVIKSDQVRVQTLASGAVWTYDYQPQPDPADQPVVIGRPRYSYANMVDPQGNGTYLTYDRGRLIENDNPAGNFNMKYAERYIQTTPQFATGASYQFEYHDITPTLLTKPEHDREYFEHDARGNITLHSWWPKGAPEPVLPNCNNAIPADPDRNSCCSSPTRPVMPPGSVTVRQTFLPDAGYVGTASSYPVGCGNGTSDAKLCNKPMTQVDGNNNQTDYTYDPAHGGVLTETLPPDSQGIRPQTRYTYVQRYAWILGSGGGYVQASAPVWLLASKSICRSSAASGNGCAVAGDEVVTAYDYGPDSGPNNLNLRGIIDDATGLARRTCYGYDAAGNKISETKPRAGLTACP